MTILEYLAAKSGTAAGTAFEVLKNIGLKSLDPIMEAKIEKIKEFDDIERIGVVESQAERINESIETIQPIKKFETIKE